MKKNRSEAIGVLMFVVLAVAGAAVALTPGCYVGADPEQSFVASADTLINQTVGPQFEQISLLGIGVVFVPNDDGDGGSWERVQLTEPEIADKMRLIQSFRSEVEAMKAQPPVQ